MLILLAQPFVEKRRGFFLYDLHHLTGEVAEKENTFFAFQFLQVLYSNGIEAGGRK